ncbi:laccase-4-like [Gigantopelta aegis]|uniref:laccase-4-like n=1 Tax=Gigantopelta aegis TaxID=1735272 RepID=UPI001B889240|nr:laccase-4-like [Gigantopelta aegis]
MSTKEAANVGDVHLAESAGVNNAGHNQTQDVARCHAAVPHPCNRECVKGEKPRTCEYNFTVEWYLTLSKACHDCPFNVFDCSRPHCVAADGLMRPLITVNRQMPGPAIEVCENDRVVVWVTNHLDDGETTSIHWHGIHQVGTPYADGVGHVTQCPIGLKEKFKYDFIASPAGTHWYHSHTGVQLADGVNGAFVVRQPQDIDPNRALYDHDLSEHVIVVNDWPTEFNTAMSLYLHLMHDIYNSKVFSGLINGKRRHFNVSTRNIIESNLTHAQTPLEIFKVETGHRYRFRFIGAMGICPFMVSFEKHRLTVIATDGAPVKPRVVDSFIVHPGERYDLVLNADQSVGNYWLKAVGLRDCIKHGVTVNAILRYKGAQDEDPSGDPDYVHESGIMLNPLIMDWKPATKNEVYGYNHTWLNVDELRHAGQTNNYTDEKVDVKLYLGMDYSNNDNTIFNNKELYPVLSLPSMKAHFTPTLNNITFDLPPIPILSQPEDVDQSWFCNRSTIADSDTCFTDLCLCTHVLHVPLHAVVELILFNIGTYFKGSGHPMHIHGFNFRVLGKAKVSEILPRDVVTKMDDEGKLPRNLIDPPVKDTIHIADGGYAIIRFKADNPGLWLYHCQTDGHVMTVSDKGGGLLGLPSSTGPVSTVWRLWLQQRQEKMRSPETYERNAAHVCSGNNVINSSFLPLFASYLLILLFFQNR